MFARPATLPRDRPRARTRGARAARAVPPARGCSRPRRVRAVPFDQYHEPPEELSEETRTFARICASLIEEAEAIGWYAQRLDVERHPEARAIMENAQGEEFKHFAMNLEFLTRRTPRWRLVLQDVLFREGDIVEHGEQAEDQL